MIACAALLGGAAVGVISDQAATEQIKSSIDGQLRAHLNTRTEALRTLTESVSRDLQVLQGSPAVSQALTSFVAGWTDLGQRAQERLRALYVTNNPNPPGRRDRLEHAEDASLYSVAHSFYHPRLRRHRDLMGYADLLLLSPEGLVLYSVAKANDFAFRIDADVFDGEPVRAAYLGARERDDAPYVFTDLKTTHRLGERAVMGAVATALTRPDGALLGFLIVVLGVDSVNAALNDGVGFGETGQTYLVGTSGLLRSRLRPPRAPRVLQQAIEIAPVTWALDGEAGVQRTLWQPPGAPRARETIVAYAPAELMGVRYALIAETPAAEVFAPLDSMRQAGLLAGIAALLVLAGLSFVLARAVTQPLDRSTGALRRLMNGDLTVHTPIGNRSDEIGDLETAVAAFKTEIAKRQQAEDDLRRAKEEADAANRAKSDFLAVMSHEVRTPMHGVLGLLELIQQGALSPRQADAVTRARASSQALLGILNDILDLSKIEAGELTIAREPVDVREVADCVVDAYSGTAAQKKLWLDCMVEPDVPERILTDPLRLRQVLWNLVGNAVKFTDRGTVALHVSRTGDRLAFAVEDTGIGIASESLQRLFEPFQQADISTTRRFGGTGLGLSISLRLAELLGGTIEAESELGRGARFVLTLPAEETREDAVALPAGAQLPPVAAPAPVPVAHGNGGEGAAPGERRVLIAEDDPTGAFVLKQFLDDAGFATTLADDGRQALEALRSEAYDLLITDYHMPDLNGIDLTQWVRASEVNARLPIVALTADALESTARKCREAGVSAVLTKPVARGGLLETVTALIADGEAPAVPRPSEDDPDATVVFDPAYLREIYDTLPDARDMIDTFLHEMSAAIDRTARLLEPGEEAALATEAHRAASACFFMGAMQLGVRWRALDAAASQGAHAEAAAHHGRLAGHLAALRARIGETLGADA